MNRPLNQTKLWLRMARWPNLIIVAMVQMIFYFAHVAPVLKSADISPHFDWLHVSLFVLCTLIVTATGNIINDIIDIETDLINKPNETIITKLISKKQVLRGLWLVNILGMSISVYLALYAHKPLYSLLYPTAILLLWLYNKYWKGVPVFGNLVIAAFGASAFAIIVLLEQESLSLLKDQNFHLYDGLIEIILGFTLLAFFIMWMRELVKDMQDYEGDKATGWNTFVVVYGMKVARLLFTGLALITLSFQIYWLELHPNPMDWILVVSLLAFPIGASIVLLWKRNGENTEKIVSRILKATMLGAIIYLSFNAY